MLRALLAFVAFMTACVSQTSAQAVVPVFTVFSPTVIRVTIGASMCTAWSQLLGDTVLIVYCINPSGHVMLPASAGQTATLDWPSTDGHFTWTIQPSKTAAAPAVDWSIAATPTGGQSVMKQGTF
jgi:hypothetical protein